MKTTDTDLSPRFQPSPLRPGAWLYWPFWPGLFLAELPDEMVVRRYLAQEKSAAMLKPLLLIPICTATTFLKPGLLTILGGLGVLVAVLAGLSLRQIRRLGGRRVARHHWKGPLFPFDPKAFKGRSTRKMLVACIFMIVLALLLAAWTVALVAIGDWSDDRALLVPLSAVGCAALARLAWRNWRRLRLARNEA
ncbi:hypothetical protein [Teichococcus oryzae]|uniref:Uncharacterized protein n=1 Tax=Teichococcus oryzae TaxID=1608942 RepID=A0A5B2TGN0_9PROT|nr:hypothetical protein [Pseudoroseomonas oryzae]KAA2213656.1 hypothetical protein F0Q34_06170 [Pseudoroseomonas oryzae]